MSLDTAVSQQVDNALVYFYKSAFTVCSSGWASREINKSGKVWPIETQGFRYFSYLGRLHCFLACEERTASPVEGVDAW